MQEPSPGHPQTAEACWHLLQARHQQTASSGHSWPACARCPSAETATSRIWHQRWRALTGPPVEPSPDHLQHHSRLGLSGGLRPSGLWLGDGELGLGDSAAALGLSVLGGGLSGLGDGLAAGLEGKDPGLGEGLGFGPSPIPLTVTKPAGGLLTLNSLNICSQKWEIAVHLQHCDRQARSGIMLTLSSTLT